MPASGRNLPSIIQPSQQRTATGRDWLGRDRCAEAWSWILSKHRPLVQRSVSLEDRYWQ